MAREVVTRSPGETVAFGEEIGAGLAAGDVLLLQGDLGAGKTTFVKGIARARGVVAMVRSPTFALMHRYRGEPDVIHLDLYRQGEGGGIEDLGIEEAAGEAITVVEWPERAGEWEGAQRIRFEALDETTRRITLT